jgi:DNA-binding transcriptional MerR regulator
MPILPASFDLSELADRAQVTPRTVRYYISQGLLPSAEGRGPTARYDDGHLNRLVLIRQLQRQHLPLAEIRRQLEPLPDSEVRRLVHSAPRAAPPSTALDYIRSVAERGHPPPAPAPRVNALRPDPLRSFFAATPAPPSPSVPEVPRVERNAPERSSARATPDRSSWERIHVSPDVELHVRRPLTREQNRQLDQLIAFAHQLFSEET